MIPDNYVRVLLASGNNILLNEAEAESVYAIWWSAPSYGEAEEDEISVDKNYVTDVVIEVTDIHGCLTQLRTGMIQAMRYTTPESRKSEKRFHIAEGQMDKALGKS